jgi:hypothetical protein
MRSHLLSRFVRGVASVALVVTAAVGQNWTDRAEYDLVLAIRAEPGPLKRLELLEQWTQKFPKTELRQVRAELQLATHEALGDVPKMLLVAKDMAAFDPRGFVGLYWLTVLTPGAPGLTTEMLSQGEQAARRLIAEAPDFFSPDRKPPGKQGAEWERQRAHVELLAHRAIGWVQWQRGELEAAENEFRSVLQIEPKQVEISAWLGTVLALQKTPEKQLEAIWHLARAAYTDSETGLAPAQQGDVRMLLERVYAVYHGDTEGMDQIGAAAIGAVMPPADFKIETAEQASQRRQDEELARSNPQLLEWVKIRRRLEGPEGERALESLGALPRLKGFVVRHSPEKMPTEIVLGLLDPVAEEVILKLDAPLGGSAEPGTAIEFEGTAVSFTGRPFSLVVQGAKDTVTGWPAGK